VSGLDEVLGHVAHVHVDNTDDIAMAIKATPTEEVEPQHFNCATFVLIAPVSQAQMSGGSSRQDIAQILTEDLLRKDAAVSCPDTPIVVGTYRQCQDPNNQITNVPNPIGAYIPAGGSLSVTGTGPLWAVNCTPGTSSRVSVVINVRDR
jgi:hypothetical protein